MKLTLEEIDSLVVSAQATNTENQIIDLLGDLDDFEIIGRPGTWGFSFPSDRHIWVVRTDVDPWFANGIRVGEAGRCDRHCHCADMKRDIAETARLPRSLNLLGFNWTLSATEPLGEPIYMSERGSVQRCGWDNRLRRHARLPWHANDGTEDQFQMGRQAGDGRWFKSYQAAMKFLVSTCEHCGARLFIGGLVVGAARKIV